MNQHSINDIVWVSPFEGYALVIGITAKLKLVVKWYNDDGESYTAVVNQDECIQPEQ